MNTIANTHPIVNGRILLPGMQFTARNRRTGRLQRFTYRGSMGESRTGMVWVNALDRRGLARAILVEQITVIHKARPT